MNDSPMTSREVRDHFSISPMTLWRWQRECRDFPRPVKFRGRSYWRRADILAWDRARLGEPSFAAEYPDDTPASAGARQISASA